MNTFNNVNSNLSSVLCFSANSWMCVEICVSDDTPKWPMLEKLDNT